MHTLFDSIPATGRSKVQFPEFLYVKGGMSRELAKVVSYYHENVRSVRSSHFLVRLLHSMNVSFNRDYVNFMDIAGDRAYEVSGSLKMTSPLHLGEVHTPGVFYGDGVNEILVSVQERVDIESAKTHWRELQPIRVLRHPFDDLTMPILNGEYPYNHTGTAVIAIDIPMLLLQYRFWLEQEADADGDARRTIAQFIPMYPIANMIYSHLDIAVFNRMALNFSGGQLSEWSRQHPFHVVDFTSKIDDIMDKQSRLLSSRRYPFQDIMLSIPLISCHNLFEAMKLPAVINTRQVRWAFIMARLPLIKFLLRINDETNSRENRYYINKIRISLREIRQDRDLKRVLPRDLYEEVEKGLETEVAAFLN